jgi:serine/threonine protein kinase
MSFRGCAVDPLQAGDPGQVGSFRLLGRLGEGGTGRVFLGASAGGRKVAVKVVHSRYASDPGFRARFAGEVANARRVEGCHTALVVDADPGADPPWIATAYIPGPSLAEAIACRGPLREAAVRDLGAALAEGVTAIHACGLIHRDLKPSSVILADDGPRIIGFGIARGTGSHAVIGAVRYMSPEQLHARELTPQSDVFAIGVILAYAATGHDPHDAPSIAALITSIVSDPPNLEPLAGGLRDIIGPCLAKNPADRPTPAGLLAQFSPGAPGTTQAPPPASTAGNRPGPAAQDTRTRTRPPAVGPPAPPHQPAVPAREARRRRRRRTTALAAIITAAAGLAALGISLGVSLSGQHSPSLAGGQHSPSPDARRSSSGSGQHSGSGPPAAARPTATLTTRPADTLPNWVAFGPGGTLATADDNSGRTYLWNTATGKVTAALADPAGATVNSAAFGPGATLAIADVTGRTYLWNTRTRRVTATLADPDSRGVLSIAFGPGATLATADYNGRTYLWNTRTGRVTATLADPDSRGVLSIAFGPGATLATADDSGRTYLWNTRTRRVTATLADPDSRGVLSIAFGPGATLATADFNRSTYLWNTATGKVTAALADPTGATVDSVAFGPGNALATADVSGRTYLWNIRTRRVTATLADPDSRGVLSIAFGPGATLATGDYNGNTYLWNVPA